MHRLSLFVAIFVSLATVGCDQSTKLFAIEHLKSAPYPIFPGVQLTYTENRDMAFGLLSLLLGDQARLWVLSLVKAVAVSFGVGFFIARRRVSSHIERLGVALVLAGAAGNLIDRIRLGYVVDFLRVPHWPVFNVADMAIVAGMGLLIWTFTAARSPAPRDHLYRSRDLGG